MTPAQLVLLIEEELPPSVPVSNEDGTAADFLAFATLKLPHG